MFTGIIESLGVVKNIVKEGDNLHVTIESNFANELKIDQSVAHNGVCLTIVNIKDKEYTVTAIKETIEKSNYNLHPFELQLTHILLFLNLIFLLLASHDFF